MFTGLIQTIGTLVSRSPLGGSVRFGVRAPEIAGRIEVGDSVACEGACLTAETVSEFGFTVCAVAETLAKTTLSEWLPGKRINLETSLTPTTSMGGHFVLGHVDGLAKVESFNSNPGGGKTLVVRLPDPFAKYCVYKGSITLSGVSLTLASVTDSVISVALIPHTLEHTTLGELRVGSPLHFEVDILAKYTEKLLLGNKEGWSNLAVNPATEKARHSKGNSSLNAGHLTQWGYSGSSDLGGTQNESSAA